MKQAVSTIKQYGIAFAGLPQNPQMNIQPQTKIFIADDDPFSLFKYRQLLLNLGYKNIKTLNSCTALLNSLEEQPEIILLDYRLNTCNGLQLLRKIKMYNPEIFIIMISGQTEMETSVQLLENGAFGYIIKNENDHKKLKELMTRYLEVSAFRKQLSSPGVTLPGNNIFNLLIEAQETVRKDIAEELHDNVNQLLGAAKLYLEMARNEKEKCSEHTREAIGLITQTISEIRDISHVQHPVYCNMSDIHSALEKIINRARDKNSFSIHSLINTGADEYFIPQNVQLNLVRIVQEQLHNISKYAQAGEVSISLTQQENEWVLLTRDDGVGFNPQTIKHGLGINSIFTRISNLGGSAEIHTQPGKGCTWVIHIPIKKTETAEAR